MLSGMRTSSFLLRLEEEFSKITQGTFRSVQAVWIYASALLSTTMIVIGLFYKSS